MAQLKKPCTRCLLEAAGHADLAAATAQRIAALPPQQRAPQREYDRRLRLCTECDSLRSGTCLKCGCYVELRAARVNMGCPINKW